jgi:hypothetical protein
LASSSIVGSLRNVEPRATADGLGELATLVVPDVARRGADEPTDRVLLGVLAHVDADDGPLVVEQELRERLGELGLADAGRTEEQERAGRPVGVGDAGARATYGVRDRGHRGPLADQALAQLVLHAQELAGLPLEQAARGDAGPGRDDLGDVVGTDLLVHHRVALTRRLGGLRLGELTFHGGDLAVDQPARGVHVALALGLLGQAADLVDPLLDLADRVEGLLLALPPGLEGAQRLLLVGELDAELVQPVAARVVGLLGQVQLLHAQPVDSATQLVDLDRARVDLHAEPAACLVDQVDGLVRQLAAGDVAVGQRCGGDQRGVGDRDLVVRLVALLEAAQDRDGVLGGGLADEHLLEPALQRRVLLDALAVLVERRRADHPQLATGQHGLEHVAGVHRAVASGAGADHGVQLVDERDDLAVGLLDLGQDGLEPLLELATVLRAGDHRREVERDQPTTAQRLRDVPGDDALGEALDDGRLADAGLADQDGIVLGAPGQHLDDAADLAVPADDRVELAVTGDRGEVDAVLLERLIRVLGVLARDPGGATHGVERGLQRLGSRPRLGQQLLGGGLHGRDADDEVLGRHEVVTELVGEVLGALQHLVARTGQAGVLHTGAARGGQCVERRLEPGPDGLGVDAGGLDQWSGGAAVLQQEGGEQVGRLDRGVARSGGGRDRAAQRLLAARRELRKVHGCLLRVVFGCTPRTTSTKLSPFLSTLRSCGVRLSSR